MRFLHIIFAICIVVILVSPVSAITQTTVATQTGGSNQVNIQYNVNGVQYSYNSVNRQPTDSCVITIRGEKVNMCNRQAIKSWISQYRQKYTLFGNR
jgi:hypothetical protein